MRMSTPARSLAISMSLIVTCRAQPASETFLCDRLKEYQNGSTLPLSVTGGWTASIISESVVSLCGPMEGIRRPSVLGLSGVGAFAALLGTGLVGGEEHGAAGGDGFLQQVTAGDGVHRVGGIWGFANEVHVA